MSCNAWDRPHDKPCPAQMSAVSEKPLHWPKHVSKSASGPEEEDKSQAPNGEGNSLTKGMVMSEGGLSGLIHNERRKFLRSVSGKALIQKDT